MTTMPMGTPGYPPQPMGGANGFPPGMGMQPPTSPGLMQTMQQMSQAGATRLPPVASGPVGTTDYATSMGYEPEDMGEELYMADPIDREGIKGLTQERMTEMADLIYTLAWEGKQARKTGGREDNIELFRDLYEGVFRTEREKPFDGASELSTPDSKVQVKTVAARIKSSIFNSPRWVTIKPGFPEDREACERCQKFLKSDMGGAAINLPVKFFKATQDALVDGTTIGMPTWTRKMAKKRQRVLLNDAALVKLGIPMPMARYPGAPVQIGNKEYKYGQWAIIETEEVIENHFDVRFISAKDAVMWPATAKDEQTAVLYGYFFGLTPNELREMARAGYYDKTGVEELIEAEPPLHIGDVKLQDEEEEQAERDAISRSYEEGEYEHGRRQLLYAHARIHDADGDGIYEDICFVMGWNSKVFIKISLPDVMNGVRPFKKLEFYPRIGGGYHPYSLIEELFDTQLELDALTRQGIDAGSISMSAIVEEEQSRRKISDTLFTPGIRFRDASREGGIKAIHVMPSVPSSNLVDRENARRMIEKIGGMDEVLQGASAGSADTLGQTNLAVAGGNIRLNAAIECGMEFLTWLYQQFFDYCQQYMEERKSYMVVRGGNNTFPSITLDDLAVTNYAEVMSYTSTLDPEASLRAQKVQILYAALANSPFVAQSMVRQGNLLTWLARSLGVDDDLSEFIGTEQEWQQMDMEAMMMQQQAGAMMGGMGGMPPGGGPSPEGVPSGTSGGPPPSNTKQALAMAGGGGMNGQPVRP